jgi:farnesyl-diphosphate farnesyltransferase
MVLIALQRADECLFYMAGVREQSVFNFVAIPQSMAIATLELCFQNYSMFEKNIKITKGSACGLMTRSTQNLQLVSEVFREYARKIHRKNRPQDPNFLDISIACANIERFIETIFPTQTPRTLPAGAQAAAEEDPETVAKRKKLEEEAKWDFIYIIIAVLGTLFVLSATMVRWQSSLNSSSYLLTSSRSASHGSLVLVSILRSARSETDSRNSSRRCCHQRHRPYHLRQRQRM